VSAPFFNRIAEKGERGWGLSKAKEEGRTKSEREKKCEHSNSVSFKPLRKGVSLGAPEQHRKKLKKNNRPI